MLRTSKAVVEVSDADAMALPRASILLLLRLRYQILRNHIIEAAHHRPLKLVGTALSILLIWVALYVLLVYTFHLVSSSVLEGIVATPLIFTFFFLALTCMLAFSSAILSYGGLFRRTESIYLLASPIHPRDIIILRYLESLILSSWSLLLLGLPLMMAMARQFDEPWTFYPLFLGIFLLFIPLPGAIGMLLAWMVAIFFPKTPRRILLLMLILVATIVAWWTWHICSPALSSSLWLKNFYDRVALVQNVMLPHTWVSKGIINAVQSQPYDAAFYLFVLLANALFASVVVVGIVAHWFMPAFSRAQVAGSGKARRSGRAIAFIGELLFAYLPRQQRLLAVKDIKTFFRDPLQWSQMAILFGLLVLYVSNVQRLWLDMADPRLQLLISFLNLTAVSLILATFTSRFVFPLVSLEGQQLWLLGLLPMSRRRMLTAKFLYALTITLIAGLSVMAVSVYRLNLPRPLAAANLIAIAVTCVGLCGVSIGMGARMPMFNERNPARIAGGFGGTASLLISIVLVVASLVGMGVMTWHAINFGYGETMTASMMGWLAFVASINIIGAAAAMIVGIRHFKRVEC